MGEDLTDVIETLRAKRAEHVASIELLDKAIQNLTQLVSGTVRGVAPILDPEILASPHHGSKGDNGDNGAVTSTFTLRKGKSVMHAAVDLANEAPRTWSAEEIIKEYERRGAPLQAQDVQNAMFSALSRATRKGLLVRVGHGKYVASKYAAERPESTNGQRADGGLDLNALKIETFGMLKESPTS